MGKLGKSWESKLIPKAREYLCKLNAEFPKNLESLKQPVPAEILQIVRSEHLNWLHFYRLQHGPEDREEFRKMFSYAIEGRLQGEPFKWEAKTPLAYTWIFKYEQLFILNHLLHPVILLHRIKKGDEKAFLDFVKVDKSILATNLALEFIGRAQLKGDKKFFKRLAESILFDPTKLDSPTLKLYHFLMIISGLSAKKLTIPEICDILEDCCGMSIDDPETVRKFWNRHNLHRDPFQPLR